MPLEILAANVYNLYDALTEARNSWESWEKSDSRISPDDNWLRWHKGRWRNHTLDRLDLPTLGPNDTKLFTETLAKAGPDHAKFRRQILVGLTIEATGDWWQQWDQYRVGADAISNSTSRMHTLGRGPFVDAHFGFDHPDDPDIVEYLSLVNRARDQWIAAGKKRRGPEFQKMQKLTAYAWLYRRGVTVNYEVLRSVYNARLHHRLDEWHTLCTFVAQMPLAEVMSLTTE